MKKRSDPTITPEEAVEFIESFRTMLSDKDEPTVAISVRIPANVLKALKTTAKLQGKKYQNLLVQYLRDGLKRDGKPHPPT